MPIFYTDSASFFDLSVTGSTVMSASLGVTTRIFGSNSTILSVSGSVGEILQVSDVVSSGLFTVSSGSNTIFTVTSDKRVGINQSPSYNLHASGTISFPSLITGSQPWVLTYNSQSGQLFYTASSQLKGLVGPGQQNYLAFFSGSTTDISNSIVYQSGSTINVGDTSGLYKLTISGSGVSGSLNTNNVLYVSGSNVGIGTSTPSVNLYVAGNSIISSSANTTTLTLIGSASATSENVGTPLMYITASEGPILSVWDNMTGSLFEVNTLAGSPTLQVRSDSVTKIGVWPVPGTYTSYRSTIPSGSAVTIYTIPTASADAAFFDYVISSGSNYRAGNFMATWYGGNITYTETSTDDIGDTSYVTMSADINGQNFRLRGQSTNPLNSSWTIKTIIKYI